MVNNPRLCWAPGSTTAENFGVNLQESKQIANRSVRYAAAREVGDFNIAAVIAGEAVDLIDDVLPAEIIVERVISEAARLLVSGAATAAPTRRVPGTI